jgi:16S rRNA (guanine527-N7)-methyltransferase
MAFDSPSPELWQALGWEPAPQQLEQLLALQLQLREWNARLNLTRLVEGEDFWVAQVLDSLWPLRSLLQAEQSTLPPPARSPEAERPLQMQAPLQMIDVGTGGGFPGLAIAIALPTARLTLVDSVGRKVEAVRAMATGLGLADRVDLRCERIELTGQKAECRGRFHLAMARAVARAPVVAEYLVPLLQADGQALLYRGQWAAADTTELERALTPLKARIASLDAWELPAQRGIRHALWLQPSGPCPKTYPRPVGVPAKQPLGGDQLRPLRPSGV